MKSTVIDSYKDKYFILRLSKDNLSDGSIIYNVSLEIDLVIMVEADYKSLIIATKLFTGLKSNLTQLMTN